jgi:hypothetical protein
VPYLEGLASSSCGSCDEDPDSDASSSSHRNAPDDTRNSSFVVSLDQRQEQTQILQGPWFWGP